MKRSAPFGQPRGAAASNMDALVFKQDIDLFDEYQIQQGIEEEHEVWTSQFARTLDEIHALAESLLHPIFVLTLSSVARV